MTSGEGGCLAIIAERTSQLRIKNATNRPATNYIQNNYRVVHLNIAILNITALIALRNE